MRIRLQIDRNATRQISTLHFYLMEYQAAVEYFQKTVHANLTDYTAVQESWFQRNDCDQLV